MCLGDVSGLGAPIVYGGKRMHDEDERDLVVELEVAADQDGAVPLRIESDDLEPDTLRAVIESFVLREGTDYGLHETALDDKVAQVLVQLRAGKAHIVFDPATESVTIVVTRELPT
jgi:uncharacterized protein